MFEFTENREKAAERVCFCGLFESEFCNSFDFLIYEFYFNRCSITVGLVVSTLCVNLILLELHVRRRFRIKANR